MPRPRTARDYQDGITAASRAGLAEVMTALGAYRDVLVLIGGWAPYLILDHGDQPQRDFVHVGSIDIDFVVDPERVNADQYATVVQLLKDRGYQSCADSKYQFEKVIRSRQDGQDYVIRVDFLTPRPLVGEGRSHRHREVQRGLEARTLEGAEVALAHWFWYDLKIELPDGAQTQVRVKVADVVGSLTLKGLAIGDRYVEKDAYDIYTLCAYFSGGPSAVAGALNPYMGETLVAKGIGAISDKFRDLQAEGPTWVASFVGGSDPGAIERIRQDAFQTVREVCRILRMETG